MELPRTIETPTPHQVLHSHHTYHLQKLIGRGGLGEVYRAWFEQPNGERVSCAVKRLLPQWLGDPGVVERFEQEAALTRQVSADHPHLVTLWDHCLASEFPFLVLEYIAGPSLQEIQGKLRGEFAGIRLVLQDLLSALEHLHNSGLIHRDVSPANVLIAPGGVAKLTDLGLAKPLADTPTCSAVGVPRYAAPEVLRHEPHTCASDLYSVGVILHELLAGELGCSQLPTDTPEDLTDITLGFLKSEPADRIELAEAFERLAITSNEDTVLPEIVERWQRTIGSSSVPDKLQTSQPSTIRASESVLCVRWRWLSAALVLLLLAVSIFLAVPASPAPDPFFVHDFYGGR